MVNSSQDMRDNMWYAEDWNGPRIPNLYSDLKESALAPKLNVEFQSKYQIVKASIEKYKRGTSKLCNKHASSSRTQTNARQILFSEPSHDAQSLLLKANSELT